LDKFWLLDGDLGLLGLVSISLCFRCVLDLSAFDVSCALLVDLELPPDLFGDFLGCEEDVESDACFGDFIMVGLLPLLAFAIIGFGLFGSSLEGDAGFFGDFFVVFVITLFPFRSPFKIFGEVLFDALLFFSAECAYVSSVKYVNNFCANL
jgi:hypothetical protein